MLELSKKDLTQIRSGLRRAFIRSQYRAEFLRSRRIEVGRRVYYACQACGAHVGQKDINVDHIQRVGTFKSVQDVREFFFSIFCSWENLQILCVECHKEKTGRERKVAAMQAKEAAQARRTKTDEYSTMNF